MSMDVIGVGTCSKEKCNMWVETDRTTRTWGGNSLNLGVAVRIVMEVQWKGRMSTGEKINQHALKTCSSSSVTSSVSRLFPLCRAITFNTVPTSRGQEIRVIWNYAQIFPVSEWHVDKNSQAYWNPIPVPINMTSYWPSSASTRSTTICLSLYGMLTFTSTGRRRAGYTGRHISGWLRANCSTESGKSLVLPNSLPGWLVILLGH